VPALLALTDVVVHPSFQEGFSNAILEAMAAGNPVVATAVGGNPEAVVHESTGLLVPPGDAGALAAATVSLLNDAGAAAKLGAAGRQRVADTFTLRRMIESYEALYVRNRRPV
jgi:glycosyltransferase involved in cell wall biosynthesis